MIRDSYSKALIETDFMELQKYRREKFRDKELAQVKEDIQCMKESINNLIEIINRIENTNG
jgi:hypothetical protein